MLAHMSKIWDTYQKELKNRDVIKFEQDRRNINPIHYDLHLSIVHYNNLDFVKQVLSEKIDLNQQCVISKRTFLSHAIAVENIQIIKFLIKQGANINHKKMNKNYLWWSVFGNKKKEIVEFLINSGLNLDTEILFNALRKCDSVTLDFIVSKCDTLDFFRKDDFEEISLFECALDFNYYPIPLKILNEDLGPKR